MKFASIEQGKRAVKTVRFRLGNAPIPENLAAFDPTPEDEFSHPVGLRVLTGSEVVRVLADARRAAIAAGAETWLDSDPLCHMYEMAYVLLVACVDAENPDEPFFTAISEILDSPALGPDNIAYLFEQHSIWQDECSLKTSNLTLEEVLGIVSVEAERPENAASPLDRMRPSTRASFLRTTAVLLSISAKARLLSTSTTTSSTSENSTSDENEQSPEVEA